MVVSDGSRWNNKDGMRASCAIVAAKRNKARPADYACGEYGM